jgi:hypothetical protein
MNTAKNITNAEKANYTNLAVSAIEQQSKGIMLFPEQAIVSVPPLDPCKPFPCLAVVKMPAIQNMQNIEVTWRYIDVPD